jgi:type II secretory ATPase GspE/PulE/Tfp pilus assembly ATPase PilB-like protein
MSDFEAEDDVEHPAVSLVTEMLAAAAEARAASIHITHGEGDSVIRFRAGGALREWRRIPAAMRRAIVARIKIIAMMDIAERRLPQNGRVVLTDPPAEYLIATVPTARGEEDVVLRRLETGGPALDLRECGYDRELLDALERAVAARSGLVVIAGPSGSGRATTRYALVSRAIEAKRVVMTAEEYVQRLLAGATQIALAPRVGLTMGGALAAISRSDPDVVMCSHLYDHESAESCLRQAIAGRLVIASLHVSSAAEVSARFADMGFEPHLTAAALRLVVCQRLLRRACERCRAKGCRVCGETGYAGHVLVAEGLELDEAARGAIARGERPRVKRTMREDAMAKVDAGATSLAEVLAAGL